MSAVRENVGRPLVALLVTGWAWISPGIAAAQAQPGPGAPPDSDASPQAQAPNSPASGTVTAVAAAAVPRAGRGESALIGVSPAPAQPPENATSAAADPRIVARGAQAAATAAPAAPATDFTTWRIPPIRWGGYAAIDLRGVSAPEQPRQLQLVESIVLKASSYVWQPWIAQVSGELNLAASQQRESGHGPGSPAEAGNKIDPVSLTGGGELSLFPASRFPFIASFRESDSRTSGELVNNAYTARRYGLSQSYTPPQGGSSFRLTYDRSEIASQALGTDTAKAMSAGLNWGNGSNSLSILGNGYTNTRGNSGDNSSVNTVYATHSYRPAPGLSVESLLNYSSNQYNLVSAGLPTDLRSRFLQLSSFATWRPEEASPLLVNGGVRFFQNSAGASGASADTRSTSAHAAATYALNRNVMLNASAVVTQNANGTAGNVFSSQSAGINYNADAVKFGEYSYGLNGSATLGNQTGGEVHGGTFAAQVGHRVFRSIALSEGSALSIDASQSYSVRHDPLSATSRSLLHSAGALWSRRSDEGATTVLGLTASETRTTGDGEQRFQLVNLQASGQLPFSRWSSASASLTVQATRQSASLAFPAATNSATAGGFIINAGGTLSYQHARVFDVPRLRYYALLNLNQNQGLTRLEGDINAPIERVNWAFEQRLDYNIGRLGMQLSMRVAEVEGKVNGMVFLRLMREFGGG